MFHSTTLGLVATVALTSTVALAGSPVMDGQRDALYGPELAVQNTQTQFGNSDLGTIDWANGSELDGGSAIIVEDYLWLFVSGNLESNFNKLEVFVDYQDGGQNQLRGDNPNIDFDGLNRMGDDGGANGLKFDPTFSPDLYFSMTCGDVGKGVFKTFAVWGELLTDGAGFGEFIGEGGAGIGNSIVGVSGIHASLDNTNVDGVAGGEAGDDGAGVQTGMEIGIPMSLLGNTTGPIKISVMVNGGGHDFLSNQVLAGLGGGPNLGDPRFVDFSLIPGDQFFTLGDGGGDPCPADIDGSGDVGFADLVELLANWGLCAGCPSDIDGNGEVGFADLVELLANWGPCTP